MSNIEFRRTVEALKAQVKGRWSDLLVFAGVASEVVNGKNQPCPMCGGTDRFSFTDKYGDGNYLCRKCGTGDGFKLMEGVLGMSFADAFKKVEEFAGTASLPTPVNTKPSAEFMKALGERTWNEAKVIEPGDPVDAYLRRRGLGMQHYPEALRCHPLLGVYEKQAGEKKATKVAEFPAMLALLTDANGAVVTLHRTYVEKGRKAPINKSKKLLSGLSSNAVVKLFEPTETLALTEGIETALAVHLSTGHPVWAAYSATNLEEVVIPTSVKKVLIYGDNDASYTGHAAAYGLAAKLRAQNPNREVQVHIPTKVGTDWADVFAARPRLRRVA